MVGVTDVLDGDRKGGGDEEEEKKGREPNTHRPPLNSLSFVGGVRSMPVAGCVRAPTSFICLMFQSTA